MRRLVLTSLALLLPWAALSKPGWEWEELVPEWTDETLEWAQLINPDVISAAALKVEYEAPPVEPWCHSDLGVEDTDANCEAYHELLDTWIQDYLEVEDLTKMTNLSTYPPECPSNCFE